MTSAETPEPPNLAAPRIDNLSQAKRALLEQRLRARNAAGQTGAVEPPVLSFAQERLWLLAELTPGMFAYNTTRVVQFRTAVDESRLRAALTAVLHRHDVLRTQIVTAAEGQPVARRVDVAAAPLEVMERPDHAAAMAEIERFSARTFDLQNDVLMRALLVREPGDSSVLAISLHHIASDEGSRAVLWNDLSEAYAGNELAPLRYQYADLARLQRAEFDRPEMRREIDWWRHHLAGAPRVIELPADYQRPAVQSYRGARHRLPLDPALVGELRALAAAHSTTVFVTVLAAVAWMLSQWSRSETVVLGMPVSGRDRAEAEGVIGLFVNTVVLRIDCGGEPAFGELIDRVRAEVLAALEHQRVPFDKVVEVVAPERDVSRNPIFQVLVNAITAEQPTGFRLGDLETEALDFDPGTTKFDLGVLVAERPGGTADLVVEYATDLFDARTVTDLVDEFEVLLAGAVAEPDRSLHGIDTLPSSQRSRLLDDVNDTAAPIPAGCLHDAVSAQAASTPDRPAVADASTALSYRELEERANAFAHHLVSLGVGPDVPVAVAINRSVAMEVAVLAIVKAGGAYVPLDTSYPADRLAFMLADCAAAVLVTEAAVVATVPAHPCTVLVDDLDTLTAGLPTSAPSTGVTPDNLAYVIYTSGSTGRPKGVQVQHKGVVNRLAWMQRQFQLTERDTVLQKTPLSFDVSVWEVFWPLMTGARLFMARPSGQRDAAYLHDVIALEHVTVVHFVPSMLSLFLEGVGTATGRHDRSLRAVMCSGEALPDDVKEQFFAALPGCELHNLYGPTEASVDVTWAQCLPGPRHRVLIGAPIDNVQVYVVDEQGRPVPIGVPGELLLAGVQLARGYLGRPDLTAERFVDSDLAPLGRVYRTGDLVRWTSAGELDYLGRIDGQVKLRGFRIELGEISAVLAEHPAVAQSTVIVATAPSGEQLLAAYVVLQSGATTALVGSEHVGSEHVDEWNTVWEETYEDSPDSPDTSGTDPYFDIRGWTSSFTGEPIPESEMAEWVAATTDRIAALGGSSVLEIGAGSGLLTWVLAPKTERYVATDFSRAATGRLSRLATQRALGGVTVRTLPAHTLTADQVGRDFDTVVANSVVQYFPGAAYLRDVLERAEGVLASGGRIFVGDVRDVRLHSAFALRAQLAERPATSAGELAQRVEDDVLLDAELLLDPGFFAALPGVAHLQVQPKRGHARTEMTCFRYDVVLHTGALTPRSLASWVDWADVGGLDGLVRLLAAGDELGVRGIPNARVAGELAALDALSVGLLVDPAEPAGAVDPESLWELAEAYGLHLELSVLREAGEVDAAFTRDATPVRFEPPAGTDAPLSNDPAAARSISVLRTSTTAELAAMARARLPEYMVPTVIRVLPRLPLTLNGKLDRSALPPPIDVRSDADHYIAPRTDTERELATLWSDVLGVADIGVEDDFFRLGGHSLLAVRMLAAVERSTGFPIALRTIFETPTIAALAGEIDRQRHVGVTATTELVDRATHRARRAELTTGAALAKAAEGLGTEAAGWDVSVFPLTSAQERMWFLDSWESGTPIYTVRRAYRVHGALDAAALKHALDLLAARHDSLRTTVLARNGVLAAVVAETGSWPLSLVDVSGDPDPTQAARQAITRDAREPFDLESGPLATASLYTLGPADAVLVLRLHHVVVDGWSMDVLVDELSSAYAARVEGTDPQLPPAALPYADFAVRQRSAAHEQAVVRQLEFWRRRLAGAPPVLELPTDHPRPPVPASIGRRRSADLGESLSDAVRALARGAGTTPFAVLVAACSALLARLSGQDDLVLGTAVAGRQGHEVERSVGLFANTLLLRADVAGNPRFADLLDRAHATISEAHANQDVPYERLVEELRPERDLGRNPLFQVMINLQPAGRSSVLLDDVALTPFEVDAAYARFDLAFSFVERDGDLHATIDYRTDLYDPPTIDAMLERFRGLLVAACTNPAGRLADLPVLTPAEYDAVLEVGTNLSRAPTATTVDLIRAVVDRTPEAVAVEGLDGSRLTYRELWRRSGVLAGRIAASTRPGDLVGIAVGRHTGLVVSALAVWRAGCGYVPLDPSYPQDRLDYMISDSGAGLVLGDADLAGLDAAGHPESSADLAVTGGSLAYVIYTSGSTGRPKGVAIEHAALANLLLSMAVAPGLTAADRLLALTTFSFDIAALELFLPLVCGATVVIAGRDVAADPVLLAQALRAAGATVVQATPSTFRMLTDSGWRGEPGLRVLCGGEAMPAELAGALLPIVGELWNCYGPTETTIWSTVERLTTSADITIGKPIANTVAYVLDKHQRLVPAGTQGELWLGGAGVARGYLGRPELTAERFQPDPFRPGERMYRTGDHAVWTSSTPDGRLRCLGRTDNQIKLRGHRIELGEIESALESLATVSEAVAILREDNPGDPRIVAYVVGSAAGVLDELRSLLPPYMLPTAIVELESIPRTLNGKTDRAALPRPHHQQVTRTPPNTPAEHAVAAIWSELLGVESPSVEDDFFALGGHSLMATRLVARLSAVQGVEVPLRSVFENPTLGALAASIGEPGKTAAVLPATAGPVAVSRAGRRVSAAAVGDRHAITQALQGTAPVVTDGPIIFAMSSMQRRMWLLHQLSPGDPSYNVPVLRSITGPVDVPELRAAVAAVVDRYEILRTSYRQLDDLLVQVVHDELAPEFDVHDRRGDSLDDALAFVRALSARPFDLTEGPALRAAVVRVEDDRWLLLLCAHHVTLDGWSIDRLVQEIAAAYSGSVLAPIDVQFGDYAEWAALRGPAEADRDFWRGQLSGAPSEMTLPLSRPRDPGAVAQGRRIREPLDPDLVAGVTALARASGATPFMVLYTAVVALLSRHGAGDDIVVGTPIATRSFSGSENLIGAVINTLALRLRVDAEGSFRQQLTRAKVVCSEAYRHGDYPFDALVGDLDVERDPSRHPVFQILVAMQEGRPGSVPLGAAELRAVEIDWNRAQYDAAFSFSGSLDQLDLVMEYRADLIDARLAGWLVRRFENLLRSALSEPDRPLAELSLLASDELAALELWEGDDTSVEATLLPSLVGAVERAYPDRPAVEIGDDTISFGELWNRARVVAGALRTSSVAPGEIVALALGHSIEWAVAALGSWLAGAAFAPIDPSYPAARRSFMLTDTAARIVLTDRSTAGQFDGSGAEVIAVDGLIDVAAGTTAGAPATLSADTPAYVIYTSGSTGQPKGTVVTHGALASLTRALDSVVHGGRDLATPCRVSVNAPVSFDASIQQLLHLGLGCTLVPIPEQQRLDPADFVSYLASHPVDLLDATPTHLRGLIAAGLLTAAAPPGVVLVGGEAVDQELWTALSSPAVRAWNVYGPTEVTVDSVVAPVGGTASPVIGRPLPGIAVRVVDERQHRVPVGVDGELWLAGAQLAAGYLGRPELTASRFVHLDGRRWYRTGDIVRHRADGLLEYRGRSDDQVKIRGHRVELGEVTAALRTTAAVADAATVVRDGELVGYVVPADGVAFDPAALRHELRATLPSYLVPGTLLPVVSLPHLPNGKLNLAVLTSLDIPVATARVVEDPSGPAEELIAELWAPLLGVASVGAADDFFDLGGDSLSASRFVAQLRAMDIDLPLMAVFTHPTVRGLAEPLMQILLSDVVEENPTP